MRKQAVIAIILAVVSLRAYGDDWTTNVAGQVTTTAKVGIGTNSPFTPLEVSKTSSYNNEASAGMVLTDVSPSYTTKLDMGIDPSLNLAYIQTQAPTSYATRYLALQPNGGYIGVGTTAPAQPLEVKVPSDLWAMRLTNAAGGYTQWSWHSAQAYTSAGASSQFLLNPIGGNVGIGTMVPAQKMDVEGAAQNGSPTTVLRIGTNDLAYSGSGGAMELTAMNNRGAADPVGKIAASLTNGAAGAQSGDLVFSTSNNGGLAEHLRITAAGEINVTGNLTATGSITGATVVGATYRDVAEWVSAETPLAPATVVVLDPSHDDRVTASTSPYDTTVAGVVSSSPGVILGVGAAGKEKIATTGRVKVKVDATRSAIRIGDLLVTSDVPGMAMRSEPIEVAGTKIHRPGTVIGKALQALPSGKGEILVLLSLQ